MTTYFTQPQTCSVCGTTTECHVLGSTNSFGSPDLDLRPPEMQRSTMGSWLQVCPECGYVGGSLDAETEGAHEIIESEPYANVVADGNLPELATRFVRYALLHTDDDATAGSALLRAAWVCDDANRNDDASHFRDRAAERFATCGPFDAEERITLGAILVDVYRRAGRFDESQTLAESILDSGAASEPVLHNALRFQVQLCAAEDAKRYTVEEAQQES